jgi:truncated hemoglobin YjbI
MSGRYHGQPMEKHLPLPVDSRHFDRWLALFDETAHDVCPPAAAAHSSSVHVASPKAWSSASPGSVASF